MILRQNSGDSWTFCYRSENTLSEFHFKTAAFLAILNILFPNVKPLHGNINFKQFERNDVIGALLETEDIVPIQIFKSKCMHFLSTTKVNKSWLIILTSFGKTNCVHYNIVGTLFKIQRFYQLSLSILFSKFQTKEFRQKCFMQKALKG